jgi:hypothetical protein
MITSSTEPDALDVFCNRLVIALDDLKVRLRAHYGSRFPGEERLIRKAIGEAEVLAWRTQFPHLFLPDLVEEAMARLGASGTQKGQKPSIGKTDYWTSEISSRPPLSL